ncbi:MAG: hypothetical protein DLM54_04755 [Acidimicrobiales bacterium]|nr:MAG: hypothetical protein DLM54_04755 [Acidimicrobiales bacterium]
MNREQTPESAGLREEGGDLGRTVVTIANSHLDAPLASNQAKSLSICGSTLPSVSVANSTGFVLIGGAKDDGGPAACGPNVISGNVTLRDNTAGIELGADTISGSVVLTNNTGQRPDSDKAGPEVEANHIGAFLVCSGNTPVPVDDNQPNTVAGRAIGQCAGLA